MMIIRYIDLKSYSFIQIVTSHGSYKLPHLKKQKYKIDYLAIVL